VNQEAILAVLPDSKDDAKSLKEIARDGGLVALERRQREEGQRFWYNNLLEERPIKSRGVGKLDAERGEPAGRRGWRSSLHQSSAIG
jgi:hypothetical protein